MRVLITGCSSGLGAATTIELAARGHDVIATARALDRIKHLPASTRLALDVTDEASVAKVAQFVGNIDVVINNAGVAMVGPVEEVDVAQVVHAFDVNVFSVLRIMQAFLPAMRERKEGRIINVSSLAGRLAVPMSSVYCASKAALEMFTETLRLEVSHLGIDVVLVEPGAAESKLQANSLGSPPRADEYRHLADRYAGVSRANAVNPLTAESVASAIANIVETPRPRLRYELGELIHERIAERLAMDDADYEMGLHRRLGLVAG